MPSLIAAISPERLRVRLSALYVATRALWASLRPHHWVKNFLVFGGIIFSRSLTRWDAIYFSLGAFVLFCLASSGVYLLNDLCDREEDQRHPRKRLRPLAAGKIGPLTVFIGMAALLAGSMGGALFLRHQFAVVLGAYWVINLAYSLGLKKVVILDVMLLALGFVLRAVGGAAAIGVLASPWLILCTLMLALLVGFGKRRHELGLLQDDAASHRQSLGGYSSQFLDPMMAVSGCAAVVTYALYTMAPETVARFGSGLVLTTPWVLYGVFRYFYLVHQQKEGGDPARLFVTDLPTLLNASLWVLAVCLVLYGPAWWRVW